MRILHNQNFSPMSMQVVMHYAGLVVDLSLLWCYYDATAQDIVATETSIYAIALFSTTRQQLAKFFLPNFFKILIVAMESVMWTSFLIRIC